MRLWLAFIVSIVVAISLCFLSSFLLNNETKRLTNLNDSVIQAAKESDLVAGAEALANLRHGWDEEMHFMEMFVFHDHIDQMDLCISRMENALEAQNVNALYEQSNIYQNLLEHIPHLESIRIENVL